jgi:hypothetical protein
LETHREVMGERKNRESKNVLFVVFQYTLSFKMDLTLAW